MEKLKSFKGLVNISNIITKITDRNIITSNGVFMWKENGVLSILTFIQKLEKEIIPFLNKKFILYPKTITVFDKYLTFVDIHIIEYGFLLEFTGSLPQDTCSEYYLKSRDLNFTLSFSKENNSPFFNGEADLTTEFIHISENHIFLLLPFIDTDNTYYSELESTLQSISLNVDFDRSEYFNIDDNELLSKSTRAIELNIGELYLRIAKSIFINVNKADKLSIRCAPFKTGDNMYLITTTNCKEKCKLINLINAINI